jgi:hypothetical protein
MTDQPTKTVALFEPLKVGGKKVSEITIRQPRTGELRGLSLIDVLRLDVAAYLTLLPRITELDGGHLDEMALVDFNRLCVATQGFFGKAPGI